MSRRAGGRKARVRSMVFGGALGRGVEPLDADERVHGGRHIEPAAIRGCRDRVGDGIRQLERPDHREAVGVDLEHLAAIGAEQHAIAHEHRRSIDAGARVDRLDQRPRRDVDHVELAVARAAEELAVGEKRRRVAEAAGLPPAEFASRGGIEEIDEAVEGGEGHEAQHLVDRRRIFDRAPGREPPGDRAGAGVERQRLVVGRPPDHEVAPREIGRGAVLVALVRCSHVFSPVARSSAVMLPLAQGRSYSMPT